MTELQTWILEVTPEWFHVAMQLCCFGIVVGLSGTLGYLIGKKY